MAVRNGTYGASPRCEVRLRGRSMDLCFSAEDEAFRGNVRRFLDEYLTDELRDAGRRLTDLRGI